MTTNSYSSNEIGTLVAMGSTNPIHADSLNFPDHPSPVIQSSPAFQPDPLAIILDSSNDLVGPTIAPVKKAHGWADKESWARHQAAIKQLYLYEKKPLAEVMRLMESQHRFKATVKMYKTHIKQWGLDKKNKDFEMRAIVRKNKKRSDQGKVSTIRVRGQLRDFAEIVRYWDRKGVSIDEIIARQTASPTPEAVELFAPVISPVLTSQVLSIPEHIFRYVRNYFVGSFESGTWVKTEPHYPCYKIKYCTNATGDYVKERDYLRALYDGCAVACSLLEISLFHEAGRSLINATAHFKNILSAEHPESLVELFRLIISIYRENRDEIALILLRQFFAQGKVLLGSEHPFSGICEWTGYASDFHDVLTRCMENVVDQFENFVVPIDKSTLFSRLNLIETVGWNESSSIEALEKLLAECEEPLEQHANRTLRQWSEMWVFKRGGLVRRAG